MKSTVPGAGSFRTVIFSFTAIVILSEAVFSQSAWFLQPSGTNDVLNSVFFVNANTGFVSGNAGTILRTTNGGLNWIQVTSPTIYPLKSVYFINSQTGWICGGHSFFPQSFTILIVLKTTDAGVNWFSQLNLSSIYNTLSSIRFLDSNTGITVGKGSTGFVTSGNIMRTTNGGNNWTTVSLGYIAYNCVFFVDSNNGFASAGYYSDVGRDTAFIYATTNSGLNWSVRGRILRCEINSIHFVNTQTGWGVGRNHPGPGTIMKTTDSGNNLTTQTFNDVVKFTSVFFSNQYTGCAVGWQGKIYETTNSGANWFESNSGTGSDLLSVYFINSQTGWAVGGNGTILKTTNGGIVGFQSQHKKIPELFSLHQNYPNPFNPVTRIRFDIPSSVIPGGVYTRLDIFDLLANHIETLFSRPLEPGQYEVDWDASDYPSGVYVYELRAGGLRITKRMVLMK